MNAVLKLAWRSLWRNRRRTLITLTSIALGLALTIFMASLGAGVYRQASEGAVRMQAGHLVVEHPEFRHDPSPAHALAATEVVAAARGLPGVETVRPLVVGQAVVATAAGSVGVGVMGVEPEAEIGASPFPERVVLGRYLEEGDVRGAVVGTALARRLKLEPGKKAVLTTTDARGEMTSELLKVVGVFQTGSEESDVFLVQVPIGLARRAWGLPEGAASQVGVILGDPDDLPGVAAALSGRVDPGVAAVRTWREAIPKVAAWIELDTRANRLLRVFVIFLVGSTILNTILMSVLERGREFAVCLALGTPPRMLRAQVLAETLLLAALGTMAGAALGAAVSGWVQAHGIDLSLFLSREEGASGVTVGGFMISPVLRCWLTPEQVGAHTLLVFGLTVGIGLYPTWRSTAVPVADLLRTR
ncbi:ABC transporter permease [Myxococcota bacterium]|nr:ABC transporter permease [Myxococcota bacterium]